MISSTYTSSSYLKLMLFPSQFRALHLTDLRSRFTRLVVHNLESFINQLDLSIYSSLKYRVCRTSADDDDDDDDDYCSKSQQ